MRKHFNELDGVDAYRYRCVECGSVSVYAYIKGSCARANQGHDSTRVECNRCERSSLLVYDKLKGVERRAERVV